MRAQWIDTDDALRSCCEQLLREDRIAVDTESNSMFVYHEQICLVQVSTARTDVLIDPLAVDLAPLGPVLADPGVQKVMHGADYDVLSFKRSLGMRVENLFDTMLAARVLGWPKFGLASLLAEHFDFAANKAYQRYDWGQRPLSAAALEYARFDTHYLLPLAQRQAEAMTDPTLRELFEAACRRQCAVEPKDKPFDPDRYWRLKGSRDLDESGRAVLKALWAWREAKAESLDRPPFRVLPELAMLGVAKAKPADARALGRIKGMPKGVLRRDGPALLRIVAEAKDRACPKPGRPAVDRELAARLDALKGWRKAEATRLGVDPELVLDKASLMAVAEEDVAALHESDAARYGRSLREALEQT